MQEFTFPYYDKDQRLHVAVVEAETEEEAIAIAHEEMLSDSS